MRAPGLRPRRGARARGRAGASRSSGSRTSRSSTRRRMRRAVRDLGPTPSSAPRSTAPPPSRRWRLAAAILGRPVRPRDGGGPGQGLARGPQLAGRPHLELPGSRAADGGSALGRLRAAALRGDRRAGSGRPPHRRDLRLRLHRCHPLRARPPGGDAALPPVAGGTCRPRPPRAGGRLRRPLERGLQRLERRGDGRAGARDRDGPRPADPLRRDGRGDTGPRPVDLDALPGLSWLVRRTASGSTSRDGCPRSESRPTSSEADLGILADRPIYEGLLGSKNRIVQWMGAGLPVVYNRIGDLGDLLEERRLGLTFPPGDASALAERLAWAAGHGSELREMAERARGWPTASSPSRPPPARSSSGPPLPAVRPTPRGASATRGPRRAAPARRDRRPAGPRPAPERDAGGPVAAPVPLTGHFSMSLAAR